MWSKAVNYELIIISLRIPGSSYTLKSNKDSKENRTLALYLH